MLTQKLLGQSGWRQKLLFVAAYDKIVVILLVALLTCLEQYFGLRFLLFVEIFFLLIWLRIVT